MQRVFSPYGIVAGIFDRREEGRPLAVKLNLMSLAMSVEILKMSNTVFFSNFL